MPPTRRARNASLLADSGHIPPDRLHVKDLRSLCSKLNLTTTAGRAALIKRITEAQQNVTSLPGTPPPNQDGGKHMESTAASSTIEQQFQQLQRQVQELLDRETTQDRLLSATQLTQLQSIVHGSLNEAIEKAASAVAHAAVSAIHGLSAQASESSTQVTASSESERPEISPPSTLNTSNRRRSRATKVSQQFQRTQRWTLSTSPSQTLEGNHQR